MNITPQANLLTPQQQHAALDAKVRPVVRQWVGQTFFAEMLKQSRNSVTNSEDNPFSGGRGGSAFGSLLDQQMGEHASARQGGRLIDSLMKRIIGPPPTTAATTTPAAEPTLSVVG